MLSIINISYKLHESLIGYLLVSLLILLTSCEADNGVERTTDEDVIWKIGEADGLSAEFKAGQQDELTFVVGENEPSSDFPARHTGSLTRDGQTEKKPYRIQFDMPNESVNQYRLILDLIYSFGSPKNIEITVNGKKGIFPVRHEMKEDLNGSQANTMLLAKQQLAVPVASEWLQNENNEITIVPLGIGGMEYDALTLEKGDGSVSLPTQPHLEPTIFYHEKNGEMMEAANLEIPFSQPFEEGEATITIDNNEITTTFNNNGYDFGIKSYPVDIPELNGPKNTELNVRIDNNTFEVEEEFIPAKKWRFFITPRVHNDVGFTDLQPHVNELDNRNTDRILDVLDNYPFYNFSFETSWLVDNYLASRTKPYREKFLKYASADRAPVNALYLNLLTGLTSGEELYRATYFTHKLHREHGVNFEWASLTDAPSHSWFLPTLLNDVGVKGFVVGSNQTRAPILRFSDLNEKSPFYWEGMNGEKVMMWYSRSYLQLARLTRIGGWSGEPDFNMMQISVPQFLTRYRNEEYAPNAVMIYGAYVDNALIPKDADAPIIERWNQKYSYPKMITASDAEFFDYIDEHFNEDLPTFRGGAGAYWEDGAASTAKATKMVQQAQEKLPVAETAASLSSMLMPRYKYKSELFTDIWKKIMFYNEHTWGAYNSISQPDREFVTRQWEIKESYAEEADLTTRNVLTRSFNRLSQLFEVSGSTVFAYNFQPVKRSGVIELELDEGEYLVNLENEEPVQYDVLYKRNSYKKIRFVAADVPAMGYRGYAIRSMEEQSEQEMEKQALSGTTIENSYYRLTLDEETGGIVSLYDKTGERELVNQEADYSLNEYLYVSGGEDSKVLNHGMSNPPADLTIHEPNSATKIEHVSTPVGQRLVVETESNQTPLIRSEYQLYNDLKRIDIKNTVRKEETLDKEGVYFAFPFRTENPEFAYQIQNGWLRPNQDQLPGAAREWFTTQNLVHLKDDDYSIAWSTPDAPLFTLTDINRGKWPQHLDIDNGHVFSYVMNNYWFTNYKASQGGEFEFNYSITSGTNVSKEELSHFDAEIRKPVLGYALQSSWAASVKAEDRPLPPEKGSFMDLGSSNLQFVTLKKAENGNGFILRFRETSGKTGETTMTFPLFRLNEVYLANGVEENKTELQREENSVVVPYNANSYTTIRLDVESNL